MKAYQGTFVKKTGERRTMRFVKLSDLPANFLSGKVKGTEKHNLPAGSELVWDIDAQEFRIFNNNTVVDTPREFEYTLS